jgi:hypothetical protein
MAEDDLAVAVAIHVLDFKIRVELVWDAERVFAVLGEDVVEGGVVVVGLWGLAFLVEALWGDDLGVGEGALPGGDV